MSIFGKIKDAIFGKAKAKPAQGQQPGQAAQRPAQQQPQAMPQMAPAAPAPQPVDVDVDAVLADLAAQNGEKLNYRSSIVDLMKLLDLDSSLANRKELAEELGYTGARDGSAEMNIWLHKAVMKKLEANGGKVSADLRD
jgi:3-oxoacyl-ACP reductase-like protein